MQAENYVSLIQLDANWNEDNHLYVESERKKMLFKNICDMLKVY